jgi:hypothetical protein
MPSVLSEELNTSQAKNDNTYMENQPKKDLHNQAFNITKIFYCNAK